MSDFLTRLAARTLGAGALVEPSLPPAFATPAGSPLLDWDFDHAAARPSATVELSAAADAAGELAARSMPPGRSLLRAGSPGRVGPRAVRPAAVPPSAAGPSGIEPQALARALNRGPGVREVGRPAEDAPPLETPFDAIEAEEATWRTHATASDAVRGMPDPGAPRGRDTSYRPFGPTPAGATQADPESPVPSSREDSGPRTTLQPLVPRPRPAPAEVTAFDLVRAAEPAPTVRITIGRVEVRAVPPSQPTVAQRRQPEGQPPRLSLSEYLKRGGAR